MKIAVFENEFELLRDTFELANIIYFDGKLAFEVFETSQDFGSIENIYKYDKVLIDIDLSPKSKKDGYGILKEIYTLKKYPKLIILTGHSHIEKKLEELSLKTPTILKKPLDVQEIAKCLS